MTKCAMWGGVGGEMEWRGKDERHENVVWQGVVRVNFENIHYFRSITAFRPCACIFHYRPEWLTYSRARPSVIYLTWICARVRDGLRMSEHRLFGKIIIIIPKKKQVWYQIKQRVCVLLLLKISSVMCVCVCFFQFVEIFKHQHCLMLRQCEFFDPIDLIGIKVMKQEFFAYWFFLLLEWLFIH